jgi:hypothetical protein
VTGAAQKMVDEGEWEQASTLMISSEKQEILVD